MTQRSGHLRRIAALFLGLLAIAAPVVHAEVALRRSGIGEPQTLDPQRWTFGQDGNIAQDLYQSLTTVDAAARTVPGQAESWTIAPDGRTYTFRLRPGLQWSDGVPISSADFVWSMRRLFDPRTAAPAASLLYMIRNAREVNSGKLPLEKLGVSAPDPRTVVIELAHPSPSFVEVLVHRGLPAPRHLVEKYGADWTRQGRIASNGAFMLAEWRPGAYVKLVRNPRFHQASSVRLDALYHVPIEDPKTALNRFRGGELDIAVQLPSEQIDQLRRDYPKELHLVPQIGLEYFAFNTRRPPLDDVRVRRALSMAIDRGVLTERVLRAGEAQATGVVPPGVLNYPKRAAADFASWPAVRRIAEARRLLAEAGYGPAKPLKLRMRYSSGDTQRKVAVAVAAMWQPLGVRAELITAELRSTPSGQVRYQLKTPYRDGTTHLVLEPLDLMARLAALVPPPRMHLTRYHGVFAPHSTLRAAITPAGRGAGGKGAKQGAEAPAVPKHVAMGWAQRLKRVFAIEIETCVRCQGRLRVIASIEEPEVIARILAHRERDCGAPQPELAPIAARAPPRQARLL